MRAAAVEALTSIDGAATRRTAGIVRPVRSSGRPAVALRPEFHVELIRGLARHVDAADDLRCTAALRRRRPTCGSKPGAWSKPARHAAGRSGRLAIGGRLPRADRRLAGHGQAPASAGGTICDRRRCGTTISAYAGGHRRARPIGRPAAARHLAGAAGQASARAATHRGRRRAANWARRKRCSMRPATSRGASAQRSPRPCRLARRGSRGRGPTLLDDSSGEVQHAVLAATDKWPMNWRGRFSCRRWAATVHDPQDGGRTMAARWPPAAEFCRRPGARRAEVLDRLQTRFRQDYPLGRSGVQTPADDRSGRRPRRRKSPASKSCRGRKTCAGWQKSGRRWFGLEQLVFDRQEVAA